MSSSVTLNLARAPVKPYQSRVVLQTYPDLANVDPCPMDWGNIDPQKRGPVVVTRNKNTIGRRNAIGAHGGSCSTYTALAVASGIFSNDYKPNFTGSEPKVEFKPQPAWGDKTKIVSLDPWGHVAPWEFRHYIDKENIIIRPTIAVTKSRMNIPDIEQSVQAGKLKVDGEICVKSGELNVTKVAVEPCWYLPGVAERFGTSEADLRRCLFEESGGSYPDLITRDDIKLFLPPIGGLTVYAFGDVSKISDPKTKIAVRIHDECNGSDVFGSDICTCRPYLIFGIEECVKEAQNGGVGIVVYFRKEGRALGEVTKLLVYNARKSGEDKASDYFTRTEEIAGVKDMRFQVLMTDILHWLGITRIDRMLSMSNMKHDAIVDSGIKIVERVPLPDDLVPPDGQVEIEAKKTSGYFTNGPILTTAELEGIVGRKLQDERSNDTSEKVAGLSATEIWEEVDH